MAVEKKRMQQRYGSYSQYIADKANLLSNEFASVISGDPNTADGSALYFKSGTKDPKRIFWEGDTYSQTEIDNLLAAKANSGGTINVSSLDAISGKTAKLFLNAYSYAYDAYGRIISYTWDSVITANSFSIADSDKANRMYICLGSTVTEVQANAFADVADNIIKIYIENISGSVTVADTTITNKTTYRQSSLMDFYILASLARLHQEKLESGDVNSKLRLKENKLDLCVTFNKNFIPLTFLDETATTIGAGQFATGNTSIVTAFVSRHITSLQSGAFANCTKLTDLYIDNLKSDITIASDAVPTTTTIHYLDDGWSVNNYVTQAIYYLANAKITKDRLSASLAAEIDGKATQTYVDELADDFTTQLAGKLDDIANSVKETNLNTYSVSSRAIQPNAVTTEKYAERSIQTRHIDESYLDKIEPSNVSGPYHDGNVLITSAAVYNALQNVISLPTLIQTASQLNNYTDNNKTYIFGASTPLTDELNVSGGIMCVLNNYDNYQILKTISIGPIKIFRRTYIESPGFWTDFEDFTGSGSDIDAYTKEESKSRFGLTLTVCFDSNDIPILIATDNDIAEDGSLRSDFATGNNYVKTVFISSDITEFSGTAFEGCVSLTDIYIDNVQGAVTIENSDKLPENVVIHYVDDFNNVSFVNNALCALYNQATQFNTDIVALKNNTNMIGVMVLEREKSSNKVNSTEEITDATLNYPTVNYMQSLLANKPDIEIGAEFDYTATYADDAHMTGIYTLMGDLCFIIATAHIKSGWADIDYPLPVAAVVNSACIATDGIKAYRVSTDATQSPTHLYIHTVVEGGYQNEGNISFCLVYRYY